MWFSSSQPRTPFTSPHALDFALPPIKLPSVAQASQRFLPRGYPPLNILFFGNNPSLPETFPKLERPRWIPFPTSFPTLSEPGPFPRFGRQHATPLERSRRDPLSLLSRSFVRNSRQLIDSPFFSHRLQFPSLRKTAPFSPFPFRSESVAPVAFFHAKGPSFSLPPNPW